MDKITIKAYGKLNLYLDITGKREDGYHLLRSVMQSVSVCDTLCFEIGEGSGIELICDEPFFPKDNSNLIWKAAEAFYKAAGIEPRGRLTVTVDKKIPAMAGMAGGSADCAAALKALNELYGRLLPQEKLMELAASLGADVPFMLAGGTQLCEGIGEKLSPLPSPKNIYFAVVRPDVSVSTPEAYKAYDSRPMMKKKSCRPFERALEDNDPQQLGTALFNALEAAVDMPEITEVRERLIDYGALGSLMTGSGSAVFGVFDNRNEAEYCIGRFEDQPFAAVLTPVASGLEIVR